MRSMYQCIMMKELSQKVKLSIYWTIRISALTYGHELCDRKNKKPNGFSREDPEHNGVLLSPLEEMSMKKEVVVSLLRLLPPQPHPDEWKTLDGWKDILFLLPSICQPVWL